MTTGFPNAVVILIVPVYQLAMVTVRYGSGP